MIVSVDIETYSEVSLSQHGVYKYAEDESFDILLIAYSIDGEEVIVLDTAHDDLSEFEQLYRDTSVLKRAWNANFELVCLSAYFNRTPTFDDWECDMVAATRIGLPASLDKCGEVLNIENLKDKEGKALIRYFSMPCAPTKVNGGRTRNMPSDDAERWQAYKDYCKRDVEAEMEIAERIQVFETTDFEHELWRLDQKINFTGIKLDIDLVEGAVALDEQASRSDLREAKELTGLDNPNSTTQLLEWLNAEGADIENVQKASIEALLSHDNAKVRTMARLRLDMSRSSVKKYTKMRDMACEDERVKGMLQFNGAARTGRWAGRGVQLQNLTKHFMRDGLVDIARDLIREQDFEALNLIFKESPQDILSQLVRTAFIPGDGHQFYVSDFSAIEARVIAWYAGEKWRLDVFKTHGKIYEASASQMFNVPIENVTRENGLRDKGKVAELALGYQGGVGALKSMGAEKMGLSHDEMSALVSSWRAANQNIQSFWYGLQQACVDCVTTRESQIAYGLKISMHKGFMMIELPSGRRLAYPKPRIRQNRWGGDVIVFKSLRGNTWTEEDTYGGKLVENVVQATARDILSESMMRMDKAGYTIVGHVHDELIIESKDADIKEIERIMSEPIHWCHGLPLASEGFVSKYYKKD